MATTADYYAKFDEDGEPEVLFRVYFGAGGADEQVFKASRGQWVASAGFLEDVLDGSFYYGAIEEENARDVFPEAFSNS